MGYWLLLIDEYDNLAETTSAVLSNNIEAEATIL